MREIILVSFYNRGAEDNPLWEVYAHTGASINTSEGTFSTEAKASQHAHGFGVPVIRGMNVDRFIAKLSGE